MARRFLPLILSAFLSFAGAAAQSRLIVVISIDRFPYEYISRYHDRFGAGGFRLLMDHGANFTQAIHRHANTLTGPGHAVMLTGATASQNGIIGNHWYDETTRKSVYCAEDTSSTIIGAGGAGRSPKLLVTSTFGDELRLQTNFRSKVISISHKDRAAILMGGKLANAAFWMSDSLFVSSSYYAPTLPSWLSAFNASGKLNSYFGRLWKRASISPLDSLIDDDDVPYENSDHGLGRAFPHPITGDNTRSITRSYYDVLLTSPFGNEVLAAAVKEAVNGERLGTRGVTDLLCVSFSSNDYVGHSYGPNSLEAMEMAVSIDSILADLFSFFERKVGVKNCIIALTSDHGVAPIPEYIRAHVPKAETGKVAMKGFSAYCNQTLNSAYGTPTKGSWVEKIVDKNIYLNPDAVAETKTARPLAAHTLALAVIRFPGMAAAFSRDEIALMTPVTPTEWKMRRSYYPSRSGDVLFALKPYFIEGDSPAGTTHGEPYDYSSHVPLFMMGAGITAGTYRQEASPTDIAPTLSSLTGVEFPSGRDGRVLIEALGR